MSKRFELEDKVRLRAAAILRELALGNDPQSGTRLEPEHLLNRAVNSKALLLAAESLELEKAGAGRGGRPERLEQRGLSWGEREDAELRDLFEDRLSRESTSGGFGSRLVHLGLVQDKHEAREMVRGASGGGRFLDFASE